MDQILGVHFLGEYLPNLVERSFDLLVGCGGVRDCASIYQTIWKPQPGNSVVSAVTRRTQMSYGSDRWRVAEQMASGGNLRLAREMRFYALSKMLEAAEIAALVRKMKRLSTFVSCKPTASA